MAIKLTQKILFDGKTKGLKSRYYFNKKVNGKRRRSYYPTEKEAKAALAAYEKHLNQWGKVSEKLSPDEAKDYTDACAKMPHAFGNLCDWVDHLLANVPASATQGQGAAGKLSAIIEKFLAWKKEMVDDGSKGKKGKRLINQETYDCIARDPPADLRCAQPLSLACKRLAWYTLPRPISRCKSHLKGGASMPKAMGVNGFCVCNFM